MPKNNTNEKALLLAARKGDLEECERLVVDLQTDVNARDSENEIGWSPLLLASRGGHAKVVACLLRHGANVNYLSASHQSPLHAACWNGHKEVAAILISYGADVNVQNRFGQTPLHWACHYGYTDIVKLLLQNGADVTIRNDMGNTAFDKAISMQRSASALLIQEYQPCDPDNVVIDSGESIFSSDVERKRSVSEGASLFTRSEQTNSDGHSPEVVVEEEDDEQEEEEEEEAAESPEENGLEGFMISSESDKTFDDIEISHVEIHLDRETLAELARKETDVCSVTEYEDDGTTKVSKGWIGRVDWKRIWVIFLIVFVLAMMAWISSGIAMLRRRRSVGNPVPPLSIQPRYPTQSPMFESPGMSPSTDADEPGSTSHGTAMPTALSNPQPVGIPNSPWLPGRPDPSHANPSPPSDGSPPSGPNTAPSVSYSQFPTASPVQSPPRGTSPTAAAASPLSPAPTRARQRVTPTPTVVATANVPDVPTRPAATKPPFLWGRARRHLSNTKE